jgi:hypothetical protein
LRALARTVGSSSGFGAQVVAALKAKGAN